MIDGRTCSIEILDSAEAGMALLSSESFWEKRLFDEES
jgi:hypothetical protein